MLNEKGKLTAKAGAFGLMVFGLAWLTLAGISRGENAQVVRNPQGNSNQGTGTPTFVQTPIFIAFVATCNASATPTCVQMPITFTASGPATTYSNIASIGGTPVVPNPTPPLGYSSQSNQTLAMTPGMNTSNRATTIDTNIQSVATAVQNNLALNQLKASMTPTTTPVLVRITYFKFTTSSSGTPTPIATAVASTFHHTQYFFSNTGTTGDSFTVYNGSVSFPTFLAPQACLIRSFVDTASNVAISIGGPVSQAGCIIEGYGLLDAQPYQVPINLTAP